MTTRRTLLAALAAGAAGGPLAAALAGCERGNAPTAADPDRAAADPDGARLLAEVPAGLTVLDPAGRPVIAAVAGVFGADWTSLASARDGIVTVYDTRTGRPTGDPRAAALRPRIVSPDGRLIGLATPKAPRERTTIEVHRPTGDPTTMELPGNQEPEAFSPAGDVVYVLDYLPPAAPDRYRVRRLDVGTGELRPLNTRLKTAVPPSAEEEMRGEGRQAVYDPTRQRLFTLYTHQPEHVHTRDLIHGARADAPHVHAFVHTLSLIEGWAYCIDLPAPFGAKPAAGHAIALATDSSRLTVIEATTGTVAVIDPEALAITGTLRFAPRPLADAAASAAFGRTGELAVAAGTGVTVVDTGSGATLARWSVPAPARGLAIVDGSAYVGGAGAITSHDLTTGRQTARVAVPALTRLLHALPPR